MKKSVLKFGILVLAVLGFASCKDEKNEMAEQKVKALEMYVDSLKAANAAEVQANWEVISMEFDRRSAEANDALGTLNEDDRTKTQGQIDVVTTRYNDVKTSVEVEKAKIVVVTPNPNQLLRDRLFGAGKIGEDMNFAWVNKDNILNVYDTFFQGYKDNKENFSREDYDEIKLMYEALDSRKNTVEKEGLSSEDNGKIASIKFKFSPMFKVNRMGAKSRENEEAKE